MPFPSPVMIRPTINCDELQHQYSALFSRRLKFLRNAHLGNSERSGLNRGTDAQDSTAQHDSSSSPEFFSVEKGEDRSKETSDLINGNDCTLQGSRTSASGSRIYTSIWRVRHGRVFQSNVKVDLPISGNCAVKAAPVRSPDMTYVEDRCQTSK